MRQTIYISGPMTGVPKLNGPLFDKWADKLRGRMFRVVNPHDLGRVLPKVTWEDCLRRDIKALMECDGVAVLPRWKKSRGANLEVYIAKTLKMPIHTVEWYAKRRGVHAIHTATR